jgi:hypothetical protein
MRCFAFSLLTPLQLTDPKYRSANDNNIDDDEGSGITKVDSTALELDDNVS